MATIKFPSEMPPASSVGGNDKLMISKDGSGEAFQVTFNSVKEYLEITDIELDPVQGGATEGNATVIAPGPSGQRRKMDASPGWYSVGGNTVEAEAGHVWKMFWNGTTWSLVDMGALPVPDVSGFTEKGGYEGTAQDLHDEIPEVSDEYGESSSHAASQALVTSLSNATSQSIIQAKRITNHFLEPNLQIIEFDGSAPNAYLSDIIKSFEIQFSTPFVYFKNDGLLRRMRVNHIQETSTYYLITFAIESVDGNTMIGISGSTMQILKNDAPDRSNIPFTVTRTITGIGSFTITAIYDFTKITGSVVANSIDFTNGKLNDSILLKDRQISNKAYGTTPSIGKAIIFNSGVSEWRSLPNNSISNADIPPIPLDMVPTTVISAGLQITWLSDFIKKITFLIGSSGQARDNDGNPLLIRVNRMALSGGEYIFSGNLLTKTGSVFGAFNLRAPVVPGDPSKPITVLFNKNSNGTRNYNYNFEVTAYWNALGNFLLDRTSTEEIHYGTISYEVSLNYKRAIYSPNEVVRASSIRLLDDLASMLSFGTSTTTRFRDCFICAPDPHMDFQSLLKIADVFNVAPPLINYVRFLFTGGDLIHGTELRETTISELEGLKNVIGDSRVPIVTVLGDHDFRNDNLGDQNFRNHETHALTKADQRQHIIQPSLDRLGSMAVAPENVCYYYIDNTTQQVRHVILDGRDQPMTTTEGVYDYDLYFAECYRQEQLEWLAEIALVVPNNNWAIVVHTHMGVLNIDKTTISESSYSLGDTVSAMWAVLVSFKNKTSANILRNAEIPINLDVNFSSANGRLAAVTYGHVHGPSNQVRDGINLISFGNSGNYPTGTGARIAATQTEYCADYVLLDNVTKDIRCIRTGRRGGSTETFPDNRGHRFLDSPLEF